MSLSEKDVIDVTPVLRFARGPSRELLLALWETTRAHDINCIIFE